MNNNFFFTLVGLTIAVFAICNVNISKSNEGFINVQRLAHKTLEVKPKSAPAYTLRNNNMSTGGGNAKFVSYPSFQTSISPRFNSTGIGANIRYNTPDLKYMAAPKHPVPHKEMVSENYQEDYRSCNKNGSGSYSGEAPQMPQNYSSGNYKKELASLYATDGNPQEVITDGTFPIGDMQTIDASGNITEPVVMERLMFANAKSHLHAQGDFIRGDLAIAPCNTGWFQVSVIPARDLNRGAMNVLGGINNETSQATAALVYDNSGNTQSIFGGVDMSNQFATMVGSQVSGGPVTATSFP
jgi:hypothetical protein